MLCSLVKILPFFKEWAVPIFREQFVLLQPVYYFMRFWQILAEEVDRTEKKYLPVFTYSFVH